MRRALALATILGAAWAAVAAAAGGGPSPGLLFGGPGKLDATGTVRYVALPAGRGTVIESIGARDGRVIFWSYLRGTLGIPMVAWDGSVGGLSREGNNLVLASPLNPGSSSTRFALLDPSSLKVRETVKLHGAFAFDALSPDGSLMYLIQYLGKPGAASQPYAVRAFSWTTRKLYPGAVVDKREADEKMTGLPVTRAGTPAGWAYTLYQRPRKRPFVHALDTVHRRAFCVDLPWRRSAKWINAVRLRVRGGLLELRRDGRTITRIDRKTLEVRH